MKSLESLVQNIDTQCSCGWKLPFSVMPMHLEAENSSEDHIVPNAMVCLVCPECGEGHAFYSTMAAAAAPKIIKKKLFGE